jgi:hypothetical protein
MKEKGEKNIKELPRGVKIGATLATALLPSCLNSLHSPIETLASTLEGAGLAAGGLSFFLGDLLDLPTLNQVLKEIPLVPHTRLTLLTVALLTYLCGRALELGGCVAQKMGQKN